jgi:hypothetical protein
MEILANEGFGMRRAADDRAAFVVSIGTVASAHDFREKNRSRLERLSTSRSPSLSRVREGRPEPRVNAVVEVGTTARRG